MKRLWAILLKRCPRCLEGQVYARPWKINETCPVCGYRFQRDAGHFLGAMYFNYPLGFLVLGGLTLLIWKLLPEWSFQAVSLLALVPFLLLAGEIVRYSRVVWMHFDGPFPPWDGRLHPEDPSRKSRGAGV